MALIGLTLCAPTVEQLLTLTRTWTNQQKASGRSSNHQILRRMPHLKLPRERNKNPSQFLHQTSRNPEV